jgi:hypothetical protein
MTAQSSDRFWLWRYDFNTAECAGGVFAASFTNLVQNSPKDIDFHRGGYPKLALKLAVTRGTAN